MDVYDNPRGADGLVRVGIIAAGAFALYRFSQSGGLGPTAKQFADSLWGAAAGTQLPISVLPAGGGGVVVRPVGGVAPVAGRCPDFTTGVNYVADRHDGTFETVIGGALVYTGSQAEAEAQYRHRMGCG